MAATPWLIVLALLVAIPTGIVAVIYVFVPFFKGIAWLIRQVFRFIFGEIGDALRVIGTLITSLVLIPLVVVNVLIGRWSAAAHFGRAINAECRALAAAGYRIVIGHPARLLCLTALTEGIENRLPQAMAHAPTGETPARVKGRFDGYTIVGSLPGGGSGGKLYIAEPDAIRRAAFERSGQLGVKQVVIKTFSLEDGSSLPQIVRESRALEAAKKLGLVLDHELTNERFYYVMRYVPGDSLSLVTQRLHALSGAEGLSRPQLRLALGYAADLLGTLSQYHKGGLWHKDVKPDNIIIDADSAHLVDFGLVTPLRSGMTLTTHGTEYFRDPEMVRLALKGVKVHQVDGAKFDLYAAGAVMYSMIENSFPAHGGLSQLTKQCPEALRWIIRRAMTEYDKRYTSAEQMLADLDAVRRAADPFSVKPADLPSMRGVMHDDAGAENREAAPPAFQPADPSVPPPLPNMAEAAFANAGFRAAGSPVPPPLPRNDAPFRGAGFQQAGASSTGAFRTRPTLRVTNWWSGRYAPENASGSQARTPGFVGINAPALKIGAVARVGVSRPAYEQLSAARERVAAMRDRARTRATARRGPAGRHKPVNFGVLLSAFVFIAMLVGLVGYLAKRPGTLTFSFDEGEPAHDSFSMLTELPEFPPVAPTSPASPSAPSANEVGANAQPASSASPAMHVSNPARPAPRVVVSGVPAIPERDLAIKGQRLLVISDVQPHTPAIAGAIERLRAAGLEVQGNFANNPASPEQLQKQLDREAEAKMTRALSPIDDESLRARLSDWLSSSDLAGLVWFARDAAPDGTPGATRLLLVTPRVDRRTPAGGSLNEAIMGAVSASISPRE
jgi:serine/threonine protein kinase